MNTHDTFSKTDQSIIVVNLNVKKPMDIVFMNKNASKLTGYDINHVIGLPVNILMPDLISHNHQRFVDIFLAKGK